MAVLASASVPASGKQTTQCFSPTNLSALRFWRVPQRQIRHRLGLQGASTLAILAQQTEARPSQDPLAAISQLPAVTMDEAGVKSEDGFCVINFYHLADLEEPEKVALAHKARLEGSELHGRIYISSQGINAQYSGPEPQAVEYAQWVRSHAPFESLMWTTAPVAEHAFPRLRVAYRASLVSLAGGTKDLPITDASQRATPLSPAAWKDMLRLARPISLAAQNRAASNIGGDNQTRSSKGSWRSLGDTPRQHPLTPAVAGATLEGSHHSHRIQPQSPISGGSSSSYDDTARSFTAIEHSGSNGSRDGGESRSDDSHESIQFRVDDDPTQVGETGSDRDKGVVVLDVRNGYEWDAGHFQGAARPQEATFSETPTDVAAAAALLPEELRDCSGDTPVMMYCTGGIRCDIYSTYLRRKGFNNLYTLEGGVHAYLKEQGGASWDGSLFVFDDRLAVPAGDPSDADDSVSSDEGLPAAVACQLCSGSVATLPHLNCANIDCSRLFVACGECKSQLDGCCCEACRTEGRLLRPNAGGATSVFRKASSLFSSEELALLRSGRGEGRLRRRRNYEARLREKHRQHKEQRAEQRVAVKVAMAARGLAPDAETQASGRHRQEPSEAFHPTE